MVVKVSTIAPLEYKTFPPALTTLPSALIWNFAFATLSLKLFVFVTVIVPLGSSFTTEVDVVTRGVS